MPDCSRFDVTSLGQVFTPPSVVQLMLSLRRNQGRVLEPSCGDGAFSKHLPGCVAIELDAHQAPPYAQVQDFFGFPESEQFETILGNPPYVRFRDINRETRRHLGASGLLKQFHARSNLYLFFIEKCLRHLPHGGELIFITPRDFMKSTSSVNMNKRLFAQGSFTDVLDLGDMKVFSDALPNCLVWRYEKGCYDRRTRYAEIRAGGRLDDALRDVHWQERHFMEVDGHILFTSGDYPLRLDRLASVRVGGVSGADAIFASVEHGTRDFVCSTTVGSGQTRRMIWCEPNCPPPEALFPYKEQLIARKVRRFDESNWWHWGRNYPLNDSPRVYVNGRTRQSKPFFCHASPHFDGAVLALFPQRADIDIEAFCAALNQVAWDDLGFMCDGRYIFTQRSLTYAPLPAEFAPFLPESA